MEQQEFSASPSQRSQDNEQPSQRWHLTRRQMLGTLGAGGIIAAGAFDPSIVFAQSHVTRTKNQPLVSSQARQNTLFGIGYETWFMPGGVAWNTREATPTLGLYRSDDPNVIKQHAQWISGAGYDFILIDWSNNLGANWTNGTAAAIIAGTDAVFQQYAQLSQHPKIALLLGQDDNGQVGTANFNAQIAEIKNKYLNNSQYSAMLQQYQGKPLLSIFRGPASDGPPSWSDPAFTVRYMTAYHEIVGDTGGQWSWIDREPLLSGPLTKISYFGSNATSLGENQNNAATSSLGSGHTFGQSFTFSGGALNKVGALLATYNSTNSGATITLYAGAPGSTLTPVVSQTFTNLTDNAWIYLNFNPQPAGQYYLEMSNAVGTPAWWYENGSVPNVGGSQYFDRQAQPGSQMMTFSASGAGGLNGWQVGAGWSLVPNGNTFYTLQSPEGYYASTSGSSTPGSLTSPPFPISGTFLTFYAAGMDKADNSGTQNYFYLKDASTGQVLQQTHTPNTSDYFALIEWDVRALSGRQVVFQASNGNASSTGWMAFANIAQVTAEFSVATAGVAGNNGPTTQVSSWALYDAKPRLSGATLAWFMQQIYVYQPDIVLLQQWNEFGQPDMYTVEASNDLEPTVLNNQAGPNSDGWGTYYLQLTTDMISQYRQGKAYPAVTLDTTYP